MTKTFISHSSFDHPFVEWLKRKLERENLGLDIFVDDGSVFCRDDPQKMIEEVKRSIIFIPVLSNESVKKEFVQNELKTANRNETTNILPIKLKCDKENVPKVIKTKFKSFDKVEGKIYEDFSNEKEWDIHYGYLNTNPQPIKAQDAPGSFIIPQWPALEYLEKVSNQISDHVEAINNLLEIIKSVTYLKNASGEHIDNYRTWYYFTKILINLPTKKTGEEIINLIPVWLDSRFST